jgi:hypothetical protein
MPTITSVCAGRCLTIRGEARSSELLIGAQEGDLADGWPMGHHAGVALARVQA